MDAYTEACTNAYTMNKNCLSHVSLFCKRARQNGILMRELHTPEVHDDDEWAVSHQIVVPNIYRSEVLSLAHKMPMSGH